MSSAQAAHPPPLKRAFPLVWAFPAARMPRQSPTESTGSFYASGAGAWRAHTKIAARVPCQLRRHPVDAPIGLILCPAMPLGKPRGPPTHKKHGHFPRIRRGERRTGFRLGPPPIRRTGPILLDSGRAQSGKAVAIDRTLPSKELVGRQRVTIAGFFKREQSTPNGGDDFCFATNYPACRPRCWEISKCQLATVGADDILHFRALGSTILFALD